MVTFNIQAKPLPSNFRGTPNQLLRAFLDRIEVIDDKHTFVESDTQPATNVGPWFKNGTQLWVWNGTTYIPIDVSESAQDQIWIGPSAPSPLEYQYWFQVSGLTVTGLKYYLNGVWTGIDSTIAPGSVVTATLADSAATTDKFADGSVTSIKIQAPLLLSKWQGGTANQFAKMDAAGSVAGWENGRLVSVDYTLALNSQIEFSHGLAEMPHRTECWLYSVSNVYRNDAVLLSPPIPVNTLLNCSSFVGMRSGKTPTVAYLKTPSTFRMVVKYATYTLSDPSIWRVRFYVTPK